ncbi:MAG: hypothetical protein U0401_20690 [Anaerolineae bacterium]
MIQQCGKWPPPASNLSPGRFRFNNDADILLINRAAVGQMLALAQNQLAQLAAALAAGDEASASADGTSSPAAQGNVPKQ